MAGTKCQSCGLVNFGAAPACRRCGTMLDGQQQFGPPMQQYGSPYGMPGPAYAAASTGMPAWAKVLIGCLIVVVLGSGVATSFLVMRKISPDWKVFTPPDGSFVVTMPGTPVEQRHVEETADGPIVGFSYSMMTMTGDEYMVMYTDLYDQLGYDPEPTSLLDHACNGFEQSGFKILDKKPATVQGHTAYELRLQVPPSPLTGAKIARHYLIWASPRLYQVSVATVREADLETDGTKFVDSFVIMQNQEH